MREEVGRTLTIEGPTTFTGNVVFTNNVIFLGTVTMFVNGEPYTLPSHDTEALMRAWLELKP